jgi:hypothetical protein
MPVFTANGGYQVTLSWTDASTNTVAINLVHTIETNGEMGYLTDTNVAKAQVNPIAYSYPSYKFAHVSPSQPYTFPASYFTNAGNKYFLFEGAGTGSGQLVLTISQATALGTNVIAQAGAWLDLHDIKDFYESSGHHEQHRRGDEQLERRSQDSAVSNRLRCQRVTGPHRHGSWHQRGQLALGERKRDRF